MPDTVPPVPESRVTHGRRKRLSLVWIIPLVAAAVGGWIAVTEILGRGPTITIIFDSAQGLEAGKTRIQYNGVDIGTLTKIRLTKDRKQVEATASIAAGNDDLLVEGTHFWVVRPRISGAEVSGLETLLSGAFVSLEIGKSKVKKRRFVALKEPPVVESGVPGRFFVLKTDDLGSLEQGTPVYLRRLKVGQVSSYKLNDDGKSFDIMVFVNAPYDQYVNPATRFWQASGIDVSLNASGVDVETQSLLSILIGGVAFQTPASAGVLPPAEAETRFELFASRASAFQTPLGEPEEFVLVFGQSIRGLEVGAPVELEGVRIGEVAGMKLVFDTSTDDISVPVTIRIYQALLGLSHAQTGEAKRRVRVDALVKKGYRAQLRTGSLLTGSLFVSIDHYSDPPPATVDWSQQPPQLPTVAGGLAGIEDEARELLKELKTIPFQKIGQDVAVAITQLNRTLKRATTLIESANGLVQPDSVLVSELDQALQEASGAARAVRVLADYLERHPEALIRGKSPEEN